MSTTPNGYPVLDSGSPLLHTWVIPGADRRITVLAGPVGLILIHIALWFNDLIERLDGPGNDAVDEGGHNKRLMTGSRTLWSEHSGGDAEDLNWNRHPYNTPVLHTFTPGQVKAIRKRIRWLNWLAGAAIVEWGGNWPSHPGSSAKTDSMHWQIIRNLRAIKRLARILAKTPRGRKILAANPGQLALINS